MRNAKKDSNNVLVTPLEEIVTESSNEYNVLPYMYNVPFLSDRCPLKRVPGTLTGTTVTYMYNVSIFEDDFLVRPTHFLSRIMLGMLLYIFAVYM